MLVFGCWRVLRTSIRLRYHVNIQLILSIVKVSLCLHHTGTVKSYQNGIKHLLEVCEHRVELNLGYNRLQPRSGSDWTLFEMHF
jgi:hypothetical protein